MVKSIVIPHDTSQEPWLEELADFGAFQMAVGGWLDLIEIPALGVTVYMNEAARRRRGPINTRATALWWLYSAWPTETPVILGDVVVAGTGADGSGSHVPEALVRQILDRRDFVVQVGPHGDGTWYDSFARFDSVFDAAAWCTLFGLAMRGGPQFRISGDVPIDEPLDGFTIGGE